MSPGVLVKGVAALAFVAVIAGATYGVQTYLGEERLAAVQVDASRTTLNATAGHNVTFAVDVRNQESGPSTVVARITGAGIEARSGDVVVPGGGVSTVFVPVSVPADASPGTLDLTLRLETPSGEGLRERPNYLGIRVLGPGVGLEAGDTAVVLYTGRITATGRVFNTNDALLVGHPFPQTNEYRASEGVLTVATAPEPSVVAGFYEGILGMQAGESRTFTFPPEKGYGEASIREELPREETIARIFQLAYRTDTVGRDVFDDYVSRTNQGDGASFEAGEIFRFEQGPNRWPYRITAIDDENVEYTLDVEPGERYTLYPFWGNASVVENVTDSQTIFRTDPTTGIDEPFTMKAYWPDMSAVARVNETEIVVRHDPPVGYTFTQPATQVAPERESTILELGADTIVITSPSDNPLAGQSLTFDVLMLEVRR